MTNADSTRSAEAAKSAIGNRRSAIRQWLLAQQYRVEHPYTHAAPGGWAWTNLPGGVPDADDTAGAILALKNLGPIDEETRAAAFAGIEWLLNVQNSDGGIPTFCRGWGALPFDRSSADITAHAVRAWLAWKDELASSQRARVVEAAGRAIGFLLNSQRPDGASVPLWFGNQFAPREANVTYGTARVVCATSEVTCDADVRTPLAALLHNTSVSWLVQAQNPDGSWGGDRLCPSSVEETAVAVEALAAGRRTNVAEAEPALARGVAWLIERIESGTWREPAPIGFYFAKLWYFERLYPLIFTVGALRRVAAVVAGNRSEQ